MGEGSGVTKLRAHCQALAACRLCGHPGDIVPIVSNAVAPRAMIVGQAPGKVEAAGGMPFAGRAGKTLFRWLAEAGIDETTARRKIYIAAVTRCFPGPSPSGRGDRVPTLAEQQSCAPWLDAELRIVRPRLLIPIGKLAIARFLPPAPLETIIGRAHDVQHVGGKSVVIPLPHPSGASSWIHQGNHPELLAAALRLIRVELETLGIIGSAKGRSVA
jgi:uracil-DNA glycosylase